MPSTTSSLRRRASAALVAACTAALVAPAPAAATPRAPRFGPGIEGYAPYQGQTTCDPAAKPGVLAFQRIVLDAYPFTRAGGIGRDCSSGGQSEHKEGRAWDWGVSASVEREKAAADEVVAWLLARDAHGNAHALARRLGIMYLIWNRRVWSTWGGWEIYCVQHGSACYDPDGGGVRHPHTDHVHFSFGWPGARKQTSFWDPALSRVAGVTSYPAGDDLWAATGNGQVFALGGAGRHGDATGGAAVVGIASTPSGEGYWIAGRDGSVRAFGDAPLRGDASGYASRIVEIAAAGPRGYWLLGATGRVFAFGDAPALGGAARAGIRFAAMVPAAGGDGYVLVARNGRTFAFGDAVDHGGVATVERAGAVAGAARRGDGYWIADRDGHVFGRGPAPSFGDLSGTELASPVAGIAPSAGGDGYWLVTGAGRVHAFGDAPELGRLETAAAPVPAAGPAPGALPDDH
ncbi:MAG TPA: hypothetical protein VHJ34_06010 [Actinomycetota bacterium]|nr:hypothetical protein [Actinomycetota bacterium]